MAMDKKTKKRLEVLRQKLDKAQKLLTACKQQNDDQAELDAAQQLVESLQAEVAELKGK